MSVNKVLAGLRPLEMSPYPINHPLLSDLHHICLPEIGERCQVGKIGGSFGKVCCHIGVRKSEIIEIGEQRWTVPDVLSDPVNGREIVLC